MFCVYVHRLSLAEVTCLLPINHWFIHILTTIHNLHYVLFSLNIISMKPLKYELRTPFIATALFNFHHKTCLYIACHQWKSSSLYNRLHQSHGMWGLFSPKHVSHDQIWSKMFGGHHQHTSTTISIHKLFEHEHFFSKLLSWEKKTILNVLITIIVKNVPFVT